IGADEDSPFPRLFLGFKGQLAPLEDERRFTTEVKVARQVDFHDRIFLLQEVGQLLRIVGTQDGNFTLRRSSVGSLLSVRRRLRTALAQLLPGSRRVLLGNRLRGWPGTEHGDEHYERQHGRDHNEERPGPWLSRQRRIEK